MILSKKKIVAMVLSVILFGGLCFTVGMVYSNGGTPTIDPASGEGMSGFSWYNATIGVNAPYYYQNGELFSGGGGGNPFEPETYLIFKDGANYKAKNGVTGIIDYSSTNASYVINTALSLSEYGVVLVKSGVYYINTVIQMRDNTCLIGMGNTTVLYAANDLDDTVIENYDHENGNHNFLIMNLMINGNAINQDNIEDTTNGITITESWDWEISKVWVYNTQEQGIRIASGCYNGLIQDFKIWDANWTGLGVTYYDHLVQMGNRPHDIRIENGYVENCEEFSVDVEGADRVDVINVESVNAPDTGLQLYQTSYGRLLDNRVINSTEWGIRSYTSSQAQIQGNMIQEYDTGNTGNYDGIYIESDRNQVTDNYVISDHGRASIYVYAGQWTSVSDNWLAAWPMAAFINVGGSSLKVEGNYGYDTPWYNASIGVDSPEFYRSGQNYTAWIESLAVGGGVTDHGDLTGLTDDDHTQYQTEEYTSSGLADHAYSGTTITGTAGEALTIGDLTFLDSDGKYWQTDANLSSKMFCVALSLESTSADASGLLLIEGYLRDDSWTGWTVGSESPLLVSWTLGEMTQTLPTETGDQVQIIGYPIASKIIRFDPDSTTVEVG